MGKVKRTSLKLDKTKLKSSIIKRKSLKQSTPLPKNITMRKVQETFFLQPPEFPEFSEIRDDSSDPDSADDVYEGQGQFVRAPFFNNNNIDKGQIRSGVKALFELISKTSDNNTELFDDEQPLFLQITAVKVPKTPNRQVRLLLKHSLLTDHSEICLIVGDLDNPKDYDGTIEHYQKLLIEHDITRIKTILPFHQFKMEYGSQFELKRKLVELYDYFLVDGKIAAYVAHLLGKIFFDKRKMPTSIKMDASNLKDHIEKSLRKTVMKVHSKGDSYLVQVGHSKMSEEEVFENICEVINELSIVFPGSLDNIRELGLKTMKGFTIPIYLTLKKNNTVNVPVIRSKRPKGYGNVTGELTTFLNKDVTVLPNGRVILTEKHESTNSADEDVSELADTDFLEDENDDFDEDSETNIAQEDLDDMDDSETEEVQKPSKKGKANKQEVIDELLEEDNLVEAEQMYLSEYEQTKKTNTRRNKAKTVENESETKENKPIKTEQTVKKQKKIKNEEPVASNVKNDNIEQLQVTQRTRNIKKIKLANDKDENIAIKTTKKKLETVGKPSTKNTKNIQKGTSKEEETAIKNQSKAEESKTGKQRQKRALPIKNDDVIESSPPKRNKRGPKETHEVTENQAPKPKQTKVSKQASKKGTDNINDNEKKGENKDVKQTKKGKGKQIKNGTSEPIVLDTAQPVDKNIANENSKTSKKATNNKKLKQKDVSFENNAKAESSNSQLTIKNSNRQKQKMQKKANEEVPTDVPPVPAQNGKRGKTKTTNEKIPSKKSKKNVQEPSLEIETKKEKSKAASKKNEKNATVKKETKNTKKEEVTKNVKNKTEKKPKKATLKTKSKSRKSVN